MNPNLYCMYCRVHVFDLIPVKKLNSNLQPPMSAKQYVKRMALFFFFGGEQFLLKNDQSFIIKKKNHSLPPNSAVLLSLPAILKLLERYSAICSLCALLPMFGKLTSLISTFEWLKEMV